MTRPFPSTPLPVSAPFTVILEAAREHRHLHLLLDYDGTLVPLAPRPDLAAPDAALMTLLSSLAATPRITLQIVSGRDRKSLDDWFGHLPASLWAEHGFWHRPEIGAEWRAALDLNPEWLQPVRPIFDRFALSTPGAWVEVKTASLAWHYRRAATALGTCRAEELRVALENALSSELEVLEGKKVIEVRVRGVSKATVADQLQASRLQDTALVAFGDDPTDEELFVALPPASVTIAVGRALRGARYIVDDFRAVRRILDGLCAMRQQ